MSMHYRRLGASGMKVSEICLLIPVTFAPASPHLLRCSDIYVASDIANTANMRYIPYSNI